MSAPNPMTELPDKASSTVSKFTLPIAGLFVDIYGLSEFSPAAKSISCLWLHHPRLRTKEDMAGIASMAISAWHSHSRTASSASRGLIAVAFDQRNHGTRLIDHKANEAWRGGNKTHAQDMFGMTTGMVVDTGHLMDGIEGYLFGNGDGPGATRDGGRRVIDQHLALGVSLGGHSVWQAMFAEPRLVAGVVVIGCPDYMYLMTDRARLSRLDTYSSADNGASFLGSKDFPSALVEACEKYDPKGILFGAGQISFPTSDAEKQRLRSILDARLHGKKFQILSGGRDKLVPYEKTEPFLDFFKSAAEIWHRSADISVEDIVYPTAGHVFSVEMMRDAVRFIVDTVREADGRQTATAKI